MHRLARSKQCSRTGSLTARKRRSRIPRAGYLANPASLIGIPRLEAAHAGSRITFGCSDLTALAQTLVEIGLAAESDWIAAGKTPAALVDSVFRRFLRDHGQEIIAEHFELSLTLGESIVDTSYSDSAKPVEKDVPNSNGLKIAYLARPVGMLAADSGVPPDARTVSVFLVNRRTPQPDERKDEAFAFQVQLEISGDTEFLPRPDLRSLASGEWDERVADLQYRDTGEYSVGHNVATDAVLEGHKCCNVVRTCWIPQAEVERVEPAKIGCRSEHGQSCCAERRSRRYRQAHSTGDCLS